MDIPGWFDWADLYDLAVERAPEGAVLVECGTFFGRSAHHLATAIQRSGKRLTFHTWDSWLGVPPGFGYPGWQGGVQPSEARARAALAGLPVTVRTGDAVAAAAEYPDGGLFLVYLDDDHSADHVARECAAWWPKVAPGSVLAGHDYDWPSVREGVARFAADHDVAPFPVSRRSWAVVRL